MTIQQVKQNRETVGEQQGQVDERPAAYSHWEDQPWPRKRSTSVDPEGLARALGWFSIGLGLAQVTAPRAVADWIGVSRNRESQALLRTVGLREIATGVGLLTQPTPVGWVQARVGGDAMDLALLGTALIDDKTEKDRVAVTMAAVAGIAIADLMCSQQLREQPFSNLQSSRGFDAAMSSQRGRRGIGVKQSITINRAPQELYTFWRDFQNLPRLMSHLESVQVLDEQRSHWRAKAPAGMSVEWDAEITADRPHEEIAWRSVEGADVANTGSVRFRRATGDRGTVVTVELRYDPPGGKLGAAIAKLFREEPEQQIADDLRAFKQVMETGEVVRSDGSLWGATLAQRPAQPPRDDEL